jgi:hypothetical protein
MKDIYELKASKYKYKYFKLKQELVGGTVAEELIVKRNAELDRIKNELQMIEYKQVETIQIINQLKDYIKNLKEEFKKNIRYDNIISGLNDLVASQSKAEIIQKEAKDAESLLRIYIKKTHIEIPGDIEILQNELKEKVYNANVVQQNALNDATEELRIFKKYFLKYVM